MVGKEIAVKKYVVRLSTEERAQLDELIRKGKRSAQLLTKGPHPAEGGRIGARRRLERQPDCRGAGHQHRHYRADQAPAGRGGVRGGVEAQIQSQFRPAADFRRRSRSKIDRADPLSGPGGFRPLEPAPARGEGRRTAHCRARQRQHDRADAKKTFSNRIASSNG